jgi:sulfotransferase family protein
MKLNSVKFIFVGGSPRSGTTLVQKILLSHKNIGGGPEFNHNELIIGLYNHILSGIERNSLYSYVNKDELNEKFNSFIFSFFNKYIESDTNFISEKSPSNILVSWQLMQIFPESVFINIYRDGRAVLSSHFDVKKRAKKQKTRIMKINIFNVCRHWNNSINSYFELTKKIDPNRILNIKYEDLITTPEQALLELFNFLNLMPNKKMLNPENIIFNNSKHDARINDIWYTKEMYAQKFNTHNIEKWRNNLNILQKLIANILMSINLNKLGYSTNKFHRRINKFILFLSIQRLKKKLKNSSIYHFLNK